jgi:sRNA-binding regulator protein Hfq
MDRTMTVSLSSSTMIRLRDEKKTLTFNLINGQKLQGVVRWFDDGAYHIALDDRTELTVLRHAVLYYSVD